MPSCPAASASDAGEPSSRTPPSPSIREKPTFARPLRRFYGPVAVHVVRDEAGTSALLGRSFDRSRGLRPGCLCHVVNRALVAGRPSQRERAALRRAPPGSHERRCGLTPVCDSQDRRGRHHPGRHLASVLRRNSPTSVGRVWRPPACIAPGGRSCGAGQRYIRRHAAPVAGPLSCQPNTTALRTAGLEVFRARRAFCGRDRRTPTPSWSCRGRSHEVTRMAGSSCREPKSARSAMRQFQPIDRTLSPLREVYKLVAPYDFSPSAHQPTHAGRLRFPCSWWRPVAVPVPQRNCTLLPPSAFG